jgi:hypothetical protein
MQGIGGFVTVEASDYLRLRRHRGRFKHHEQPHWHPPVHLSMSERLERVEDIKGTGWLECECMPCIIEAVGQMS